MENILLNLGSDIYKFKNFINIDINEKVFPDLCINLKDIKNHFKDSSVDFIFSSHCLEHMKYEQSLQLLKDCYQILKAM